MTTNTPPTNASVSLVVVENGTVVQKPLGRIIELETEESYTVLAWMREDAPPLALLDSASEGLRIEDLVEQFIEANFLIRGVFQTLIKKYSPTQQLAPNVAFASGEAYDKVKLKIKKEKKGDKEVIPVAHYIPATLTYTCSLPAIARSGYHPTFHEQFHHYHWILNPEDYKAADDTMREEMPVFGQQLFGIHRRYHPNTPHGRAQEILRRLAQTQFQGWSFERKWEFLKEHRKHEPLLDSCEIVVDRYEIAELVYEGIEI